MPYFSVSGLAGCEDNENLEAIIRLYNEEKDDQNTKCALSSASEPAPVTEGYAWHLTKIESENWQPWGLVTS